MRRIVLMSALLAVSMGLIAGAYAVEEKKAAPAAPASVEKKAAPAEKAAPAAAASAEKKAGGDTLVITARLIEIPGTFPPNDLYNYVYIMKYRPVKVLQGAYAGKEILVGHYNPRIPRKQIKDKMDKFVDGDVEKFEVGATHKLTLILPVSKVWSDAIEDEYFDSELDKYYALKAEISK